MGDGVRKPNKVYVSILVCFNVIFGLCGAATLVLGILVLKDIGRHLLFQLVSPGSAIVAQIGSSLLAIGLFGFITAVIGCSAAARKCSIGWYIACVSIILIAEISLGISFLVFHDTFNRDLDTSRIVSKLQKSFGSDQSFTQSIDYAQYRFNCCGIESDADYERSAWRRDRLGGSHLSFPLTCCPLNETVSDKPYYMNPVAADLTACQSPTYTGKTHRYHDGCLSLVETWFKKQTLTFVGMGLTILLLQISALAAAVCLCRKHV